MSFRPTPDIAAPGQESVWDYPRPPHVKDFRGAIEIVLGGAVIASTTRAWRVLETSHPPTYYLPRECFVEGSLRPAPGTSWCEWKGEAAYFDVVWAAKVAPRAAWTYPTPTPPFRAIANAVAVMAGSVDRCTVDGEVVAPQPGGFYGGWVTSRVVGPFKGIPGSMGW
jgi:uncharacterized protein (DUF427 family)